MVFVVGGSFLPEDFLGAIVPLDKLCVVIVWGIDVVDYVCSGNQRVVVESGWGDGGIWWGLRVQFLFFLESKIIFQKKKWTCSSLGLLSTDFKLKGLCTRFSSNYHIKWELTSDQGSHHRDFGAVKKYSKILNQKSKCDVGLTWVAKVVEGENLKKHTCRELLNHNDGSIMSWKREVSGRLLLCCAKLRFVLFGELMWMCLIDGCCAEWEKNMMWYGMSWVVRWNHVIILSA